MSIWADVQDQYVCRDNIQVLGTSERRGGERSEAEQGRESPEVGFFLRALSEPDPAQILIREMSTDHQ
jgi:hypothetical protein